MVLDAGIFVTGTDTGVGKTLVTSWLARTLSGMGYRVATCKPVASGAERDGTYWADADALLRAASVPTSLDRVTPIRLQAPLAPHLAAKAEGKELCLADYQKPIEAWEGAGDLLVVEGVGGLLCPITEKEFVSDLIAWWGRPVLVVARLGLGTLNHTLLTLEAAKARGIDVVGVVLNQSSREEATLADETNPAEMRRLVNVPVWGPIYFQANDEPIPSVMEEVAKEVVRRVG